MESIIIFATTGTFLPGNTEFYKRPFELADKYGLKILVYTNNLKNDFITTNMYNVGGKSFCEYWNTTYQSFGGVVVWDEPTANSRQGMAEIHNKIDNFVTQYKKVCPNKPYYINMNPMYADVNTQLGGYQYSDYINYFSDLFYQPENHSENGTIWCDIYPLRTSGLYENWLRNLEILKDSADNNNLDMNLYIESVEDYIISYEELSYQSYVSLCYGAKGINYFTYRTPYWDSGFTNSHALIEKDGITKTQVYDSAKRLNEQLKNLGNVLMKFNCRGVISSGNCANFRNAKNMIRSHGVLSSVTSTKDAIVGCFDYFSENGYLAVNFTEPKNNQSNVVTLNFNSSVKKVKIYADGIERIQNIENGSLTLTLKSGEGQFVVPCK